MISLKNIYKGGFFKKRHNMQWRAPIFCEAVQSVFKIKSVMDVGCAIGDFVYEFRKRNIVADGIEGSEACAPFFIAPDHISVIDVRVPFSFTVDTKYDLCMCLEVAEHIEPKYVKIFIENLQSLSDSILISMAPPGQAGHYHVNCQTVEYWDVLFSIWKFKRYDMWADEIKKKIYPYRHKPGLKAYYNNLHFYKRKNV